MTTTAPPQSTGELEVEKPRAAKRSLSWLVTPLSILVALFIGNLMIVFSDDVVRTDLGYFFDAPGDFFADAWYTMRDATLALLRGALFDAGADTFGGMISPLMNSLYTAGPLILAGLSVSLAFRSGLFNIGAEGQVVAGAFVSGYIGLSLDLPTVIQLPLAIIGGIAGGAAWGFIAGFLKAKTGAHEVITTIMLNYVAKYGLVYLLATKTIVAPNNPQASKPIEESARLPRLFGTEFPVDWGILLAVLAGGFVFWLLSRSTVGFRLRSVGFSPPAARTAGMNVGRVTMLAMAIAGGLSGLAGTLLALGGSTSYVLTPNISSNVGFDAISVALLGRSRPWAVVGAGLLFGALRQGGSQMQADVDVQAPIDVVTVVQALIVVFIAAPALIRAIFRWKRLQGKTITQTVTSLVSASPEAAAGRLPRNVSAGVGIIVAGLIALWGFALSDRATSQTSFQFSLSDATVELGGVTFTARPVLLVLAIVVLAAGALRITERLKAGWCVGLGIVAFLLAGIIWSLAGSVTGLNVVSLLAGAIFPAAIPLIFGAMSGVISERAGIINIAIEGKLLLGAFVAAVVATLTGSIWFGLLGGMLAGVALAAVLAVLAIRYLVDQAIVGMVLNVFALGLTGFLFNKLISGNAETLNSPGYFKVIEIPLLSDIPILGPVLFSGTIFLYLTYTLIALVHFGLFHTRWGLRLRSVGEHPKAADTVGINVQRTRYRAVLLAGALAGIGGAFLVLGTGVPSTFQLNMSAGKGFIALAAVIFGRWRPIGAALAALLFGFADQLQSLLSQAGTPVDSNLLLMLPYVATLFAVAGLVGRSQAPAAEGQPYKTG